MVQSWLCGSHSSNGMSHTQQCTVTALLGALVSTTSVGGTTVYQQPSSQIPINGHVFVNPSPWPKPAVGTASVMWQRGHPDAKISTPSSNDISRWTGTKASSEEQAISIHPSSASPPWGAVQFTDKGIWGAALNTTMAVEHLSTMTLEAPAGKYNWTAGAGTVDVKFTTKIPTAFKLSPANDCAVYVSFSLYFSTNNGHFIWYSTNVFDYQRDISMDHVFIDTVSNKLIVSGPASGHSAYNKMMPGSAIASNDTWTEQRQFAYQVSKENLEQGISDGLARFPEHFPNGLPRKAESWLLTGFNMELEATPNAGAGLSMMDLTISI